MFDYIYAQAKRFSRIFEDGIDGSENLSEKITELTKDIGEDKTNPSDNYFWIFLFILGFYINHTGLINNRYSLFYISFYYFRDILNIFANLQTVSLNRILSNLMFFYLLITNFIVSSQEDPILFRVINILIYEYN
jgi:hypothetical protein